MASTLLLLTRFFLLFHQGFLFLCQLVAPLVVGQAKVFWHGLGLALLDLAAFVEERFDEVFVGGGLWDVFHGVDLCGWGSLPNVITMRSF